MPVILAPPLTQSPLVIYRDSAARSALSSLTWEDAASLGRLPRPRRQRTNLFPNGDWDSVSLENVTVAMQQTATVDETWSVAGRRSALISAAGTQSTVRSAFGIGMAAKPGRIYSAGATVRNNADVAVLFRFTLSLGSVQETVEASIPGGATKRLEVLGLKAEPAHYFSSSPGSLGSSLWVPASWVIAPAQYPNGDTYNVSGVFLGEGRRSDFLRQDIYPSGETVTAGTPVKLYIRNDSPASYKNIRVHAAPSGEAASRFWIDVTSEPDIIAWISAYNRAVTLKSSAFVQGEIISFWVRPVVDESLESGLTHRGTIRVMGDFSA